MALGKRLIEYSVVLIPTIRIVKFAALLKTYTNNYCSKSRFYVRCLQTLGALIETQVFPKRILASSIKYYTNSRLSRSLLSIYQLVFTTSKCIRTCTQLCMCCLLGNMITSDIYYNKSYKCTYSDTCDLFVLLSCGDSLDSLNCFVARSLEHSTILYEDPQQLPLLRLSWNKQDHNYLATFAMEKAEVGSYIAPV